MSFKQLLSTDRFLNITALEPPKGTDASELLQVADRLRGRAHGVLVPEMSGAIMRMGSLGAAFLLKQKGLEPIVNINCRDRNRLALQADMLSASAAGLENLFISGGDEINSGDHIEAKKVEDLDVFGLLEAAKKLQKGIDLAGNDLSGIPQFCVGSEVNAGLQGGALEIEVLEMEKKIKAGAEFFFTPVMYDLKAFESFMKKVTPFKVPVFPQVTILKSVGMARFMCRHVDGVMIPDEVINRLGKSPDKTKGGIEIAADTVKKLQDICRGALIVAIGAQERLAEVLEQVGA
jgi:methylenetetrahydrofolate reductase (NADPH)